MRIYRLTYLHISLCIPSQIHRQDMFVYSSVFANIPPLIPPQVKYTVVLFCKTMEGYHLNVAPLMDMLVAIKVGAACPSTQDDVFEDILECESYSSIVQECIPYPHKSGMYLFCLGSLFMYTCLHTHHATGFVFFFSVCAGYVRGHHDEQAAGRGAGDLCRRKIPAADYGEIRRIRQVCMYIHFYIVHILYAISGVLCRYV